MEIDEAKQIMRDATKHIDWINMGRVLSHLGDYDKDWGKFDNSMWRPDYNRALADKKWLAKNVGAVVEALDTLYKNR
jgi:hypothetical protein